MINEEKIKIYNKYNGDIDGWTRTSRNNEREIIKASDWYLIETLIQDLKLIKQALASSAYTNEVYERLRTNCDSPNTIEKLKNLADVDEPIHKDSFLHQIINIFKSKR